MEFAQLKRLPTEMEFHYFGDYQLERDPLLTHIETEGETNKYELIQNTCQRFESMKIFFMMNSNRDYLKEFIAVRLIDGRSQ
jgi:hypothetical protein